VKRLILGLALGVLIAGGATTARAHDAYDDSESNPIRLAAYAVHPAGWLLEWAVMRPIHFVVSNPALENIFGHVPHENPYTGVGDYDPYEPQN
jgi:hypothetical protein